MASAGEGPRKKLGFESQEAGGHQELPDPWAKAGPCEAGLCRWVGEEAAFPAPEVGALLVVTTSTVAGTVHSRALWDLSPRITLQQPRFP